MNNKKQIVLLNILLTFYSFCGVFSKLAAQERLFSIRFFLYYGIVLFILFIYAIVWQQLIKKLELSLAYSNKSITIIWSMIWGMLFFCEQITLTKCIGALTVMVGIIVFFI